jgi:hypothetical protein
LFPELLRAAGHPLEHTGCGRAFLAFASGVKATPGMFLTSTVETQMPKLKLRLDDLQVDTFQTTTVRKEKGTVFGEQCTCHTQCTCPGCPTCYASCNGTCDASCNGTCATTCGCNEATNGDTCYDTCAVSCVSCDFSCDDMYSCVNGVYGMC